MDPLGPEPFFAQGDPPLIGHRLLLISYAFPPDGAIGALRWEKLVGFGAGRGWTADVIAMDPSDSANRDDSRLAALPPGTRVFAVRHFTHPYLLVERRIRQLMRRRSGRTNGSKSGGNSVPARPTDNDRSMVGRIRATRRAQLAWLFYDEWRRWVDRVTIVGEHLAKRGAYQLIVSCGPPHMAHEAGRRIALATGIPHVMDLRDPWYGESNEPWSYTGPTYRRLTARYESNCVQSASFIVANTAAMEANLRERYPDHANRMITVMNGADPEVGGARPFAEKFVIMHAGGLYNGRDPRTLLRGLRGAVEQLRVTPEQVQLRFLGAEQYEGFSLTRMAAEEGVPSFVVAESRVPRARALAAIEESAMMVLLPQNQLECIPGKLFEYVQMSSWLLAITDQDSAVDMSLRGTSADVVRPNEERDIARVIVQRYQEFARGGRPPRVNLDGRFDREREADRLFTALDEVAARGALESK